MAAAEKIVDEEFYDEDYSFIQNVERLCGSEAAASIIRHFGGTKIVVPTTARLPTEAHPGSPLLKAISVEHLNLLGYVAGGTAFDIPLAGNFESEVLRLTLQGVPVQKIARQLKRTERGVYMARKRLREAGQLPAAKRSGGVRW